MPEKMDRWIEGSIYTCPSVPAANVQGELPMSTFYLYISWCLRLVQALLLLLYPTRALTFANVAPRNLQNIDYCVDKFKALSIRLQCIKSFNPGNFLP